MLAAHPQRVSVLAVDYHQALENPLAAASMIDSFLGGGLDIDAMAAAVDASLYRERALAGGMG